MRPGSAGVPKGLPRPSRTSERNPSSKPANGAQFFFPVLLTPSARSLPPGPGEWHCRRRSKNARGLCLVPKRSLPRPGPGTGLAANVHLRLWWDWCSTKPRRGSPPTTCVPIRSRIPRSSFAVRGDCGSASRKSLLGVVHVRSNSGAKLSPLHGFPPTGRCCSYSSLRINRICSKARLACTYRAPPEAPQLYHASRDGA